MKQLFIIVSVLVFVLELSAQNYVAFPTENVNWNMYYKGTCDEAVQPTGTLLRYAIHGDPTINDILYKKLCLESGDTLNPEIMPIGGLREEDKKIYYHGLTILSSTNERENLLYDFTAKVGDTIVHNSEGYFKSIVLDIDSVIVGDSYRKRYKVDNDWYYQNPDYIIEGIGSVNNGLLGHISDLPTCGTHYWEFICFKYNDVLYLNPTFDDCFPEDLLMGVEDLRDNNELVVYPNPVYNSDEVFFENIDFELLEVYSMNGALIFTTSLKGLNSYSLNVRDFSKGIYPYRLTKTEERGTGGKLIIQ